MTDQEILTVGAAYHLRRKKDGKPNISAISRDTGFSCEVVKDAIHQLETKHQDWLEDYKEIVIDEAEKILASDEFTRIRSKINHFATKLIEKTEKTFFLLHDDCQKVALAGGAKTEEEFQALKIKQFERRASLGILRTAVGMAQDLEAATKSAQNGPIGMQNFNFGLSEEGKKKLENSIERSYNRINAVLQNGN